MPSVILCPQFLHAHFETKTAGYLEAGLETFVASAPELWPGRSFLELVGSLRFLSFCAARAWRVDQRLGSFFIFAFLSALACCCALAFDTSCDIGAVNSPTASAAANMTLCMSRLPFISNRRGGAVGRRSAASPQPENDDNPHRL
jgi:hypothetical protein